MALVLNESFVTGIPGSFATLRSSSGTPTATWDSGSQAVDLVHASAAWGVWDITSQTPVAAGEVEIDLEFRADTSGSAYRIGGVWPVTNNQAVDPGEGWPFYHQVSGYDYWTTGPMLGPVPWGNWGYGNTRPKNSDAAGNFNTVGDRRVVNIRWDFSSGAGITRNTVEGRLDGVLWVASAQPPLAAGSMRPGVVFYQDTVRLHSIKFWDAPQAALSSIANGTGLSARLARKIGIPTEGTGPALPPTRGLAFALGMRDMYRDGRGHVPGTLKEPGSIPTHRRVRLFDEVTGILIREQWSDPATGTYDFINLNPDRKYTVVAYDYMGAYRAVVADNITPTPMA